MSSPPSEALESEIVGAELALIGVRGVAEDVNPPSDLGEKTLPPSEALKSDIAGTIEEDEEEESIEEEKLEKVASDVDFAEIGTENYEEESCDVEDRLARGDDRLGCSPDWPVAERRSGSSNCAAQSPRA
ncbi:hypothetical protein U1Q18_014481 [Sarracenia purpurea var. burkii]